MPFQYSSSYLYVLIVTVAVKARKVTVTGPRGTVTKDLSHNKVDIRVMKIVGKNKNGLYVRIQMWNGGYKQACAVTTCKSLINNMMIGVTEVSNYSISSRIHPCYFWCDFLVFFLLSQLKIKL